ncbi:MAG TPA: alpha/beta hydrolase [Baekduia sp.]|uniref:alpha/beta hydrolase n=1 Tax=Baekduia sp. TaxID=2600305 RepID=UPI002D766464|nr:alpha/beta hydrolase [Baekduia sp.]HET6509281.1 alpha/beta hydrolase [Baekduia sp.]
MRFHALCRRSALGATLATVAVLAPAAAQAAPQQQAPGVPQLKWTDCDDGFQCATATVPLDYTKPNKGTYQVALIKKPATGPGTRLGSLFTNPGGPGASGVDFVRGTADSLYATLNAQYDIVGFDPRGTGASQAAIDCQVNQETDGIYSIPFATPDTDPNVLRSKDNKYVRRCVNKNHAILPYVTTGNVARDLDLLRQAVGDQKLNYLGFSYGTFLGATYASLFPGKLGRVVLDGPVDADTYINHPSKDLQAQNGAFERELERFFQACAADQADCLGFGGGDPHQAFDDLVAQANAHPIPAPRFTPDPRPVTGDDILNATIYNLYAKQYWPYIAQDLAEAAAGDGSLVRLDSDGAFGNNFDGTFDPGNDRYFLIGAAEQKYNTNLDHYLRLGKASYDTFDHFWFNQGYVELNYGIYNQWGIAPNGRFAGPFKIPNNASTPLVVATTYDPATPYRGAKALVKDLGNARLLTMRGDGHTAYGGNSDCIDGAVDAYLLSGTLPADGTACDQDVPFVQPQQATAQALASPLKAQSPAVPTLDGRPRITTDHGKPLVLAP